MKVIVKVEKAGIVISKERLKGINEGDLVEIQIEKLYISKKDLRNLHFHI